MEQSVGSKDVMINLRDVIEAERAEALNADPKSSIKVAHSHCTAAQPPPLSVSSLTRPL